MPPTIAPTHVKIQGIALNAASVAGQVFTLDVPNGQTIDASTSVTVQFERLAGIRAPVLANANVPLNIGVYTNAETNNANGSITFSDFSTLVVNSVNLSPTTINAPASYTISFSLGTGQNLSVGEKIRLVFPNNTRVPNPFSRTHVLIDNTQPTSNPVVSGQTMTLVTPIALNADQIYSLQISSSGQLLNPTTVNSNYFLTFQTLTAADAVKEGPVNSPLYATTSTVSTVSTPNVSLSNFQTTSNSNYTITFNTGNFGRMISGTSTFTVTFPATTNASAATVTVNGQNATVVGTNTVRTITLPASVTINNNTAVTLVFTGVTNPNTEGTKTLSVSTSVETTPVNSSGYVINNSGPIVINSLNNLSADTVNAPANISLGFTPAIAIPANTGTITIRFPLGTFLPPTIAASNITINGNAQASVSVNLSLRQVTITLGASQLNAATLHTIVILPAAGVLNPSEPGNYHYEIWSNQQPTPANTSTQPAPVITPLSFIPSTFTQISNLNITVNPQVNNTPTNWTWTFTTGSRGAVVGGVGQFVLGFDQSVFTLGGNFPISALKVNNATPPSFTYDSDNNKLSIVVPNAVNISNNGNVTITLSSAAGIQVDPNLSQNESNGKKPFVPQVAGSNEFTVESSSESSESSLNINPLPIELTTFEVTMMPRDIAPTLVWVTATERENYGFYIDRQFVPPHTPYNMPGTSNIDPTLWVQAGFVEGKGFSDAEQRYEFKDNGVEQAGVYLYRMRQVDFDGTETMYGPIELNYTGPAEFMLFNNYPNPFNPTTNIQYTVARNAEVKIYVYDVLGRLVMKLVDEEKAPGKYVAIFDGKQFASGMYLVNMRADGRVFTKKMMLIK